MARLQEKNSQERDDYLKGFNEGYTISKHLPELAEHLANTNSDYIGLAGFKAGCDQYQEEQGRDRLPVWLNGDRFSKDDTAPAKTKGRDIEPEED